MLKIKEDVNLKELEKFGFKPKYDENTGELIEMYRICGDYAGATITLKDNFNSTRKYKNFWHIFSHNRRITDHGYLSLTIDDYEVLYDLILAGLVEKVEE